MTNSKANSGNSSLEIHWNSIKIWAYGSATPLLRLRTGTAKRVSRDRGGWVVKKATCIVGRCYMLSCDVLCCAVLCAVLCCAVLRCRQ